jgi:putative transposase
VDADTKAVIGRPVLTLMVCAFSRCVLGYYLSFDPPSLSTVIECLKHAFAPKIDCVGSIEFPILQDIFGVPTEIVVDNGLEFVGVSLQDVSADLGITLTAAPVKSPTYKIYVERFFRTLNDLGIHSFPGTTLNKQYMLLRDHNFASSPVLSIEQLRAAIERTIYAFHIDGHAGLSEKPPALVWQESAVRNGIPVFHDFDVLDTLLGAAKNRVLGRDGIEVHGLQYNHGPTTNTLLHELFDGERHRKQASIPVKIKYSPSDLGAIRVYHHKRNEYVELPCVDPDYARGLSLFQHNQIKAHVRQAALAFSTPAQRRHARLAVLDAVYEVNPGLRQTQKKALARLKMKPSVQTVMKIKGVGQSDGFVLLPHEPMTPARSDEGVLPKIAPRGAAKAKATRARKVAVPTVINRIPPAELPSYETDFDQTLWNGYTNE